MSLTTEAALTAFADFKATELGGGTFKLALQGVYDGKDVVVKIPREPLPDESADDERQEIEALLGERFRREIEAMRRVASARVVPILKGPEVRVIGSRRYLWYLEPLYAAILDESMRPPWKPKDVVPFIEDLVDGVAALWKEGLVHRDIKPKNIALDPEKRPVLLDLGATLFTSLTTLTATNQLAPHTRRYAAPEQLVPRRHGTMDFRTDLFAVGIIAYELITGEHPFDPPDADFDKRALIGAHNRNHLRALGTSDKFRTVIARLLDPAPNGRFRTTARARAAIEACR